MLSVFLFFPVLEPQIDDLLRFVCLSFKAKTEPAGLGPPADVLLSMRRQK